MLADLVDRIHPLTERPLPPPSERRPLEREAIRALLEPVPSRDLMADVLVMCYSTTKKPPMWEVAERPGVKYQKVCAVRRQALYHLYTTKRRHLIEQGIVDHPDHQLWVAMHQEFGWLHRETANAPHIAWQQITRQIDLKAGRVLSRASPPPSSTQS